MWKNQLSIIITSIITISIILTISHHSLQSSKSVSGFLILIWNCLSCVIKHFPAFYFCHGSICSGSVPWAQSNNDPFYHSSSVSQGEDLHFYTIGCNSKKYISLRQCVFVCVCMSAFKQWRFCENATTSSLPPTRYWQDDFVCVTYFEKYILKVQSASALCQHAFMNVRVGVISVCVGLNVLHTYNISVVTARWSNYQVSETQLKLNTIFLQNTQKPTHIH